MLLGFSIKRHLEEKSLEGIAIIVCVRWMLFAPLALGIVALISIALSAAHPGSTDNTFDDRYFFPLAITIYTLLVLRDVWLVRNSAKSWEENRIRSLKIMHRLPFLLLFLVPVFVIVEAPFSAGPIVEWISSMLWAFSCLSVLFYIVYFTLLLSIFRLPQWLAIFGFFGWGGRCENGRRHPLIGPGTASRVHLPIL